MRCGTTGGVQKGNGRLIGCGSSLTGTIVIKVSRVQVTKLIISTAGWGGEDSRERDDHHHFHSDSRCVCLHWCSSRDWLLGVWWPEQAYQVQIEVLHELLAKLQ